MGEDDNKSFSRRALFDLIRRPITERPPSAPPAARPPSLPPPARTPSFPPPARTPSVPPVARTPSVPPVARPASIPPQARSNSYVPPPLAPSVKPPREQALLRPPGALPERDFLDTCKRCGKCVEACPHDAIAPIPVGELGAGTPVVDTRTSPCHLCEGLKCTTACPTGALAPLADRADVRMGTAEIDTAACLAYRGAPCRACVDVCPMPGVLRFERGQRAFVPVAGSAICVGCGLCHRYCPSPEAIRILSSVDGHAPGPVRLAT